MPSLYLTLLLLLFTLSFAYEWTDWDYYKMLEIDSSSATTISDIKKAYRQQAKKWHPDKLIGSNVTQEERNERFTKIAEAYQVLTDPQEREQYDAYLKELENEKAIATDDKKWRINWKDPKQVFEEFFDFFEETFTEEYTDFRTDIEEKPFYVDQQELLYWDAYHGEVVRILQHEIYKDRAPDTIYYRVVEQNFVEFWDRKRHGFDLHPISEAAVIDEGYRQSNMLFEGDALTIGDIPLRYGPYVAQLTKFCDLQVTDDTDHIVWASDTKWHTCQLRIYDSNLVIADRYGSIIWATNPGESKSRSDTLVARLDGDASLTVYRVEPFALPETFEEFEQAQTLIRLLLRPFMSLVADGESLVKLVCVSTTSPLGCNRFGRLMVGIWRKLRLLLRKVDLLIESFF